MLLHKSVVHDSRVRREASALARRGYGVTVLELDQGAAGRLDGFDRAAVAAPGWTRRRRVPPQVRRAASGAGFVRALLRLRPDVVHAHDAAMLLPGLIGARLTGARLVYDSHELATGVAYRDGAWATLVAAIERLAVPRADAVITVSDGIARRLQERYGLARLPAVVRNVSDLRPPDGPTGRLRGAAGVGRGVPLVLHQGAPAPDRGCEALIRAMIDVLDAHLVFLGTSPFAGFEQQLRRLAERTGVAARVHFLPSVPLDELLDWTADADVGVSLLQDTCENHRLALPNKLFEYLLAGVPVVASDLPEVAEVVRRHQVGRLVDPADPRSVAEGLRAALAARGDPLVAERLRAVRESVMWQTESGRLADVYATLSPA